MNDVLCLFSGGQFAEAGVEDSTLAIFSDGQFGCLLAPGGEVRLLFDLFLGENQRFNLGLGESVRSNLGLGELIRADLPINERTRVDLAIGERHGS